MVGVVDRVVTTLGMQCVPQPTGTEPCAGRFDEFDAGESRTAGRVALECLPCPLVTACLQWALQHEGYGVWGASTPKQRRALRKRFGVRLRAVAKPTSAPSAAPSEVLTLAARRAALMVWFGSDAHEAALLNGVSALEVAVAAHLAEQESVAMCHLLERAELSSNPTSVQLAGRLRRDLGDLQESLRAKPESGRPGVPERTMTPGSTTPGRTEADAACVPDSPRRHGQSAVQRGPVPMPVFLAYEYREAA